MMDGLSAAASVIAVIQIAEDVCSKLQQYMWAVKDAKKDIERLRDEVLSLHNVLEKVDDLKNDPRSAKLPALNTLNKPNGPIEKCNHELVKLLDELDIGQGDTTMKRVGWRALKWPFSSKAIDKKVGALERYKATFSFAITADNLDVAFDINQGIEDLKIQSVTTQTEISATRMDVASIRADITRHQVDESRAEIIRWLSVVDPSSNHHAACNKHQAKTGEWLIHHSAFEDWKSKKNSLLWLYGKPGCGKTILSSTIIEHLKAYCHAKSGFVVAYFYFDFNNVECQKVENCISSIIAQLCSVVTKIPENLAMQYKKCGGRAKIEKHDLMKSLRLWATHDELKEIFLVFDALDECVDNERRKLRKELLEVIMEISDYSPSNMHLLVTSRPEYDIKEKLTPLAKSSVIAIQGSVVKSDIGLHINSELLVDAKLRKWPDETKEEIKQALLLRADGMFRWVYCQLDSLKKCKNKKALMKTLESLPDTLDETYMRILRNIHKEYQQEARRALLWLAFSKETLQVEEVAEAAVIDPQLAAFDPEDRLYDPPNDILEILGSLVTVSAKGVSGDSGDSESDLDDPTYQSSRNPNHASDDLLAREIKLAHFSVKEYLVSQRIRDSQASNFGFTDVPANQFMAESCLLYIYHYDASGLKTTTMKDLDHFPLLSYSCRFWYVHAQSIPLENQEQIEPLAFRLFSSDSLLSSWYYFDQFPFSRVDKPKVETPLHHASWVGLQTIVHSLLNNNSNVDSKGAHGFTALHIAASKGHGAVVRLLLEHGANINAQNAGGKTALHIAASCRDASTVQVLLDYKASIDVKDMTGMTALHIAASRKDASTVQVLLDYKANINMKNGDRKTALHIAASLEDASTVQVLLDYKANIDVKDMTGMTALHIAASRKNASTVQVLLDYKANINVQDTGGRTVLHMAVLHRDASVAQILLHHKIDINVKDVYGDTALHHAAQFGRTSIAQLLLDHEADFTIRNDWGETALDIATRKNMEATAKLLESAQKSQLLS